MNSCYFNLKFIKYHIYIYLEEQIYASHIVFRDLFKIKNKELEFKYSYCMSTRKASPILELERYETKLFGPDRNSIKFEVVKESATVS